MSCLVNNSVDATCEAKRKIGGVETKVWRVNAKSGFTYTKDPATGYVTALNFSGYEATGLVYLEGARAVHSAGDVPQKSEGGNGYFQHTVTVKVLPDTPADDAALEEHLVSEGAFVIQDMNKQFFLLGADNGMSQVGDGGANTGQTPDSDVSYTATFEGAEKTRPLRIMDTDFETTFAKIVGYQV